MSYVHVLQDIANKPESWEPIIYDLQKIKKLHPYKHFILYTAFTLHTFTKEQKKNIHSFLIRYQDILQGFYRITKYDVHHRDYYATMIAIYGLSCPYCNADYSIDISVPIILDMITHSLTGCLCDRTNPLHITLMH
jgi:hypothetical protein